MTAIKDSHLENQSFWQHDYGHHPILQPLCYVHNKRKELKIEAFLNLIHDVVGNALSFSTKLHSCISHFEQ
ncbi:hypothetical protein [Ectopseudomonas oleovorans]|uniref:hypothetical protein n=1 Tax=Ectopseudomonas oleovorans TaxID=301 RepID=UPI002449E48F|nr:hypothetical protein [Pseudomonas oleovorans]MDH2200013.1 hypothetical protein [Pseudomonas oleovorans]